MENERGEQQNLEKLHQTCLINEQQEKRNFKWTNVTHIGLVFCDLDEFPAPRFCIRMSYVYFLFLESTTAKKTVSPTEQKTQWFYIQAATFFR